MLVKAFVSLLFLSLAATGSTNEVADDFLVQKIVQEIDLKKHYTDITTTLELEALKAGNEVVVCGVWMLWNNAAHLVITSGEGKAAKPLKTTVKEIEGLPEGIGCMAAELRNAFASGDTIKLKTIGTFTKLLAPYPETIKQSEKQKVAFESSLLVPSPYTVKKQTTKVSLPSGSSILSMTKDGKQDGDKLEYGPFEDTEPFSLAPLRIHYVHNKPFPHATKAVKEIQISLWGNVYVEENYHLMNDGAQLSGTWSRLHYQQNMHKNSNVLREVIAVLPPSAHSLYFKDEIGNISTSRIRIAEKNVIAVLEPRFPLQKGWKTVFTFGYSLPLESTHLLSSPGRFQMLANFGPSIQDVTVDQYEIRVVFPEGSSGIDYQLPFSTKTTLEKKFWYFDTIGRSVLVARHENIVPRHAVKFSVSFNARMSVLWRKPMYFISIVALIFGVCMLLNRFEVGISREIQSQAGHSWTSEMTDELDKILQDRRTIVDHILGAIEAASIARTLTQPTAIKAATDEQILKTNKKIEVFTSIMEKSNSPTRSMLDNLISKEASLMTRASNLLSTYIDDLSKKTAKKNRAKSLPEGKIKGLRELSEETEQEFMSLVEYLG